MLSVQYLGSKLVRMEVALRVDGILDGIVAFAGTECVGLWLYSCSEWTADECFEVRVAVASVGFARLEVAAGLLRRYTVPRQRGYYRYVVGIPAGQEFVAANRSPLAQQELNGVCGGATWWLWALHRLACCLERKG